MYISLLHTLMYISLLHNLIAKTYIRLKNFFPIHILHLICNAKLLNFFAPANSDFHGSQVHCKLHFHQPSYCSVVSQKKKKKGSIYQVNKYFILLQGTWKNIL